MNLPLCAHMHTHTHTIKVHVLDNASYWLEVTDYRAHTVCTTYHLASIVDFPFPAEPVSRRVATDPPSLT